MTTKIFKINLDQSISQEGQTLIFDFFIAFSRFEFALKASNFSIGDNQRVSPNWETFVASINVTFDKNRIPELNEAVEYLLNNPPRIQMLNNGIIDWRNRIFQNKEPEINRLSLSIRDIRNNLFHGGKFNGNYQEEISRNYILLKNAITILDEWLSLSETGKNNYLEPIS